jgi:hypothetical protein
MKSRQTIVLLSIVLALCGCTSERPGSDTTATKSPSAYVKPFAFVLYQSNASPQVIRLANQISSTYGLREPNSVAGNPACCVWLEVKPNHSKPGAPYYSVTVRPQGETWLFASSEDLLEKAVNRLKESAHNESGQLVVPVGEFAYYGK